LAKTDTLYEGKTKNIYSTSDPEQVVMAFKDDADTAGGAKKGVVKGKGAVNNKVSSHLFQYLESYNVRSHFLKQKSETEMLVKKLEIIPVTVVMRNVAVGSLCQQYGLEEGADLALPVLEYYLKSEKLHDPMVNEYHIYALQVATQNDLQHIAKQAIKINAILKSFFQRRSILLVDFTLEFGQFGDKILLGDEISPDTCSFWDLESREKLGKDSGSQDLKIMGKVYQDILARILE